MNPLGHFLTSPSLPGSRSYPLHLHRMDRPRLHIAAVFRFFLGSNKVMQVALGHEPADECREGIHKLSARVRGFSGVLATNLTRDELLQIFSDNEEDTYAKAGRKATETVELEAGPLSGPEGMALSHTIEPTLRQCGLPTKLNKGVIELVANATVCVKGKKLSINQARLLKILGIKMARFRLWLDSVWANDTFEMIADEDDEDDDSDEEDEMNGIDMM